MGPWAKDLEQKEIGDYSKAVMESDIEGYVLYPATAIGWRREEVTVYAAQLRRELRSPDIHSYYRWKVVWGRKPMDA
ncbi:hypothetical protein IMZ48_29440 [Candidatus Bathyarchaeota archaeon]|nr:hypothetical protein [Candidatus Bathyarchaeota archaeon]